MSLNKLFSTSRKFEYLEPEVSSLISGRLCSRKNHSGDYTIKSIPNFTGYVKKGEYMCEDELIEGNFYRFIIVAVHSKNLHNYYFAIPFRKINSEENKEINFMPPEDFLRLRNYADNFFNILSVTKSNQQ